MKRNNRPVWPIYTAAGVFLVCGNVLPIYSLWPLLFAGGCSLAAFLICRYIGMTKAKKLQEPKAGEKDTQGGAGEKPAGSRPIDTKKRFSTGDPQLDKTLEDAQRGIGRLRFLNDKIPDPELSAQISRMEKAGAAILNEVAENPEKGNQIRRFATYYLPTSIKILSSYAKLGASGARGDNAAELMEEVQRNAKAIADAFEVQLDNLFSDEVLDVSSDIDVLKGMMKGDGLME